MQLSAQSLRLLDAFALRAKRSFFGIRQGAHRSQRRGHGVEFAEYRQYQLGDNPRAIDWNLYGRSDKLYIKRYLEEENVSLYIVIDGSRSMTHEQLRAKWDLAAQIAACASYIALATQDPVVLSVIGGPHSPRYWGGRALAPLLRFLNDATTQVVSDDTRDIDLVASAKRLATRVRFPGILLFISDFLYPVDQVAQVLSHFRARNMEIHAVQVLGQRDHTLDTTRSGETLLDSETGALQGISFDPDSQSLYQHLLQQHIANIRQHCLQNQISFHTTRLHDDDSIEQVALTTVSSLGLFV
jgi:uncharacterized protein (DUF58 family)